MKKNTIAIIALIISILTALICAVNIAQVSRNLAELTATVNQFATDTQQILETLDTRITALEEVVYEGNVNG